jgi:predicted transcriptional regulator
LLLLKGICNFSILAHRKKFLFNVLSFDRNAIRACKILKIDFVTAIAFLIRGFEKGLIDRDEALAKLDKLGFIGRYSKEIIKDATKKIKGGG